ncbi:hypothetical protein [Gordonia sp. SCSIO 19800]|uniref:hypothetical protein n=1 Tax=Gordonia sp. SCSIO 19800 TaxID=2826926 RepID=UPI001B82696D|nr:hypothetical protein [Gordonia sp. SCSIO 19800]MBR7194522.1 hypothetical protein [Gordonia sp. SCSIO 19800]
MGKNQCQLAIDALTQFFNTYSTSTPIYMELSDVPRGRALDSYIELVSVDTLPENRIHADLGYGWGFTVKPTETTLDSDLFTLTIEGEELDFETTSVLRRYHQGWVRFFVIPNTDFSNKAKATNGAKLREVARRINASN